MKVGDLVRQSRYGFENIIGVVLSRCFPHKDTVKVMWTGTGETGLYDICQLEVICE